MVQTWLRRTRTAFVTAVGAAMLLGTPDLTQAEQGKWWKPKEGDNRVERGDRGQHRGRDRGDRGSWRGRKEQNRGDRGGVVRERSSGDRARVWRDRSGGDRARVWRERNGGDRGGVVRERSGGDRGGAWRNRGDRGSVWRDQQSRDRVTVRDRQVIRRSRDRGTVDRGVIRRSGDTRFRGSITYRDRGFDGRARWGGSWRGVPVRRDVTVIRDYRYGGSYRARRVYCAPRFYGQFVYVRPVRYFIAADAFIGGFGIRARILRPHYLYGCNFCDMRYETYALYHTHVAHCHHRPSGFTISVSNWDDDFDSYWDGPYHADDSYEDDCDDCDDDDEYYDDEYYE